MKIAVTGGGGFIGRSVIRHARLAGHDPFAFDRTGGHDVLGDLTGLDSAGAVIHLAGLLGTSELFDNPEEAIHANVIGTLRILQWCQTATARFVAVTMPPVFPSVYAATKVCADRLASAWHLTHQVPVAKVCAFNAFGPGQKYGPGHPQKIIPTFAVKAWAGEPIPIWGDGEQAVDLIHVDDIGRMLVAALDHGDDIVFDAGTGVPLTVNEVASFVLHITGSQAGIRYLPMRDGELPTTVCAVGAGWDRIDWRPTFSWDRLAETILSYR